MPETIWPRGRAGLQLRSSASDADPPKTPCFQEPKSPVDPFRRCLNRLLEPDTSSCLSPFRHDQRGRSPPSECWPAPGCAAGVWVLVGTLVPEQRPPKSYSLCRLHTGTPHMWDKWWQWVISACLRQGQIGAVAVTGRSAASGTDSSAVGVSVSVPWQPAGQVWAVLRQERTSGPGRWGWGWGWRSAVRDSGKDQGRGEDAGG